MNETKKGFFRSSWSIIRECFHEFRNDRVLKLSAALAYYTVFSLPSMLVVIVGLGSVFYGKNAIEGQVFTDMRGFIGEEAALQLQDILTKTTLHHDNFIATIIGFATLLISATAMFGEIQDSINTIWGLRTKPKTGIFKMILNRILSFSMVLVLGFILVVSLLLNVLLEGFVERLERLFSSDTVNFLFILDYGLMIVVITLLFASILKVLPDAKIHWKDVLVGAFTTTILFLIGKFVIGYYLKHNSSISAYGAAGSIIIILLWVYYSAIILYLGAEFTQVWVRHRNRKIEPNKYAVWVEKNIVEKQYNTQVHEKIIPIENKTDPTS